MGVATCPDMAHVSNSFQCSTFQSMEMDEERFGDERPKGFRGLFRWKVEKNPKFGETKNVHKNCPRWGSYQPVLNISSSPVRTSSGQRPRNSSAGRLGRPYLAKKCRAGFDHIAPCYRCKHFGLGQVRGHEHPTFNCLTKARLRGFSSA